MEMFIRKNGTDIELYNQNFTCVKVFKNADYRIESGKYIIHSLSDKYTIYAEMPELTTSILHITPQQ